MKKKTLEDKNPYKVGPIFLGGVNYDQLPTLGSDVVDISEWDVGGESTLDICKVDWYVTFYLKGVESLWFRTCREALYLVRCIWSFRIADTPLRRASICIE